MRIFEAIVVVDVGGANMIFKGGEAGGDAIHHVGVTAIEADSDVVKVHGLDEFDEAVRGRKFVGNIFDEHSYSERLGEGAEVLDGSHGGFELFFVEGVVGIADVLHEKAKWNVLGDFEGAFDLVHGINAAGAVG